jgi:hypothetical protein
VLSAEEWHGLQDTVTGFLLAGVGNVDARRKPNFLIVDSSMYLAYIYFFKLCAEYVSLKYLLS